MQRRGFLGLVAGVVGTGPKAMAKAVTPASMSVLEIAGLATGVDVDHGHDGPTEATGRTGWAGRRLKQLLGMKAEEEAFKVRTQWITGLDPDTASLKSMSLGAKIKRTKRIQYYQRKRENTTLFDGITKGIFNND